MNSHPMRYSLACAALLACLACILTGCKPDNPAPSATGYYSGPMKPKATSAKGADTGGNKTSNAPGTP